MENSFKMMAVGMLMACLLPLTAAAQTAEQWQSTSSMQGSGSAYSSQVTAVGATGVNSMAGTAASAPANAPSRPRRGFDHGPEGGDQSNEGPIGDAVLPLMLMALAFGGVVAFRRRKTA